MEPASFLSLILVQPLSFPKSLQHAPEGYGFGIYMGTPTGLGALNLSQREKDITRQIYLGWNLADEQMRLVLDQVWEMGKVTLDDGTQFPFYVGGRSWLRLNDMNDVLGFTNFSNAFGVGAPIGAIYQHEDTAIEIYVECAPVFQIAPKSEFGVQMGLGIRLYPWF